MGIKKKKTDEEESKDKKKKSTGPFSSLVGGFADFGKAFGGNKKKEEVKKEKSSLPTLNSAQIAAEKGNVKKDIGVKSWLVYKNYKKAHNMITW